MKFILFTLLGLLFSFSVMGQTPHQTPEGKELWKSIRKGKADTNQVYRYLDYGYLWEAYSLDSAGKWYKKAGDLSKQIGFPLGEIKYRTNYTYVLNLKGKHTESVKLNLECLKLARKHPELNYINKSLTNLAISYIHLGKYEDGIRYLQQAADGFQKDGFPQMLPGIYSKMGQAMAQAGLPERSLAYNLKGLALLRALPPDTILLIEALTGVYSNYKQMELYQKAFPYILEAKVLSDAPSFKNYQTETISFLGSAYRTLGQYDSSLKYHNQAYKMVIHSDNVFLKVMVLKGLTMLHYQLKDYKNEERYALEGARICESENMSDDLSGFYQELAKLEARKNNFREAYHYLEKYQTTFDTILGLKVKEQIQALDAKYQATQKEKQILVLEQEKKTQKVLLLSLIATSVAVLLIGFLGYRNLLNRKKLAENEVVQLQKERQLIATNALLKGQDEERSRLARDLHDGLGGMLSGLKFSLSNMKGNMILDQENASAFQSSIGMLDNVISEMRRVAHSMMPEALVRFGLKEATQDLCDQVAKSSGVQVHFQAIGSDWDLEKSISVALYRICQELLNNILKHAEASQIQVQLVKDGNHISLTVEDNGKGFDPSEATQGAGLSSIHTRVEALGGKLDVQSKPGEGSSFLIEIETT